MRRLIPLLFGLTLAAQAAPAPRCTPGTFITLTAYFSPNPDEPGGQVSDLDGDPAARATVAKLTPAKALTRLDHLGYLLIGTAAAGTAYSFEMVYTLRCAGTKP